MTDQARIHHSSGVERKFSEFAKNIASDVGRPWTFALALVSVMVWAATGPLFAFSDGWQMVINTGTTIITFLVVFLIQNSQNRDNAAIQVKLDELLRVSAGKDAFVGIERLSDEEINRLRIAIEHRVRAHRPPH